MSKLRIDNINTIYIIYGELITCPLQQSEEELNDYKDIYAPKERYYIPMYMNEKWERDLDNDKYKRLERVDKFLLNKLDELKGENEREIFTNTGYDLANDYINKKKNLLREPDPPISDKILLERKKNDKTNLKNNTHINEQYDKNEIRKMVKLTKRNFLLVDNDKYIYYLKK